MINYSKEFETAFTGVEKTVDGTASQMENLKNGIKRMSEEIPSTTTEISAVAEAAGQLGIQTDNILEFTKTMINMGNATNLSADEAATTLARFANVTQMSQSDFSRLGSVIVALGNNFATTESEIAAMGMNLGSAGKQVGMTQSQIMALATALSSVGLEAQAGGTAFSKVMINMQLAVERGGEELQKFASVAGMTSAEFKDAFQKDATNAIMQFVDGLSKSGERGQSAIKVLDDMEIKETRLRDALLRSANASDVMNKAIELGTKAWEENTALTNEANKRYKTLDSRLETTKNKLKNLATNTGDKLTPSFNKLLDSVDKLINNFDNLNEEEVSMILNIAGIVATIGPAIKIISKLGSATGKQIENLGKLSKAIGEVKSGAEVSGIKMKLLKTSIEALSTPTGQAIAIIAGLTAAYVALQFQLQKATREITDSSLEQIKSWQELQSARDKNLSNSMAEISYFEKLKNELSAITDENGRVKEGYRERAETILGILNQALGTEYSLNGNIIESYKEMQSEVDKLIAKKKSEATLNAYQEEYTTALKEQQKAVETLVKLQERKEELDSKTTKLPWEYGELAMINTQLGQQVGLVAKYGETIEDFEKLQAASVSGSVEEINEAVNNMTISYQNSTNSITDSIEEQVIAQSNSLTTLKELYGKVEGAGSEHYRKILENQKIAQQEQLSELGKSLYEQTSKVEELTPKQIEAWTSLANQNLGAYSYYINKMPENTRQQLEAVVGTINSESVNTEAAMSILAQGESDEYNNSLLISRMTENALEDTESSISNNSSVPLAASSLSNEIGSSFNRNLNGTRWGEDLTSNIANGMTNQKSQSWISGAAEKVAGWISAFLHHTTPEIGPLKDDDKWMGDFISNLAKGINDNKSKVIQSTDNLANEIYESMNEPLAKNFGKFQGNLSSQILDKTKTVFTTPQIVFNVQELDKARLQQCFDFINQKFGSKY